MAVLTIAAFISKWGTTNFPSNGLREITGAKMREFKDDIADSFQSVTGAVAITSWKSPCVVATTANITLSGEQTIDGVLTSASRVLVKDQTTTSQNGIYVSAAGAWSRATDADAAAELEGAAVGVTQGTTQQNTIWIQTTDNITLGSSAIAWQQSGYGSGVTLIDDDTFATASATTAPSSESVKAYVDAQVGSSFSNTAANNEIIKSDGTDGVPSGLFASASGDDITVSTSGTGLITLSTGGFRTLRSSANTSSVLSGLNLRRETTGTPANGIGSGMVFEVETSASNIEQVAAIDAVTTDVTAASEDVDLVFRNMAAGAPVAESFRIKSDKSIVLSGPSVLKSYTVGTLPTASSYTGGMIYVSDESGGAIPAFSDGTNWRRVTDRAVVS